MPRVAVGQVGAGAGWVRLEAAWPERDADGEGGVHEGQDCCRHAEAGRLGEHAQGVGVADALGPFADGVVGGGRDEDGVRDQGPGGPGLEYWLRTAVPVCSAIVCSSKNSSADGVATTWIRQPRSRASLTGVPIALAGPAPHTTSVRTRRSGITWMRRCCWRTARRLGGYSLGPGRRGH
jgi:hypothetical protein